MITRMCADVLFNRKIDADKDYISFGGYEILTKSGETFRFDFLDSCGGIDVVDKRIVHKECFCLDEIYTENTKELESALKEIDRFVEFYIYTDNDGVDDNYLLPVKVLNAQFECSNGELININHECFKGTVLY